MFTKVLKKDVKNLKINFEECLYFNTTVYELSDPIFMKLKHMHMETYEKYQEFNKIEFPEINDIKNALDLTNVSWINRTYRQYKIWALEYENISVLISYNVDRGTDLYVPDGTTLEVVYKLLYDFRKLVYTKNGETNTFDNLYPTWDNI